MNGTLLAMYLILSAGLLTFMLCDRGMFAACSCCGLSSERNDGPAMAGIDLIDFILATNNAAGDGRGEEGTGSASHRVSGQGWGGGDAGCGDGKGTERGDVVSGSAQTESPTPTHSLLCRSYPVLRGIRIPLLAIRKAVRGGTRWRWCVARCRCSRGHRPFGSAPAALSHCSCVHSIARPPPVRFPPAHLLLCSLCRTQQHGDGAQSFDLQRSSGLPRSARSRAEQRDGRGRRSLRSPPTVRADTPSAMCTPAQGGSDAQRSAPRRSERRGWTASTRMLLCARCLRALSAQLPSPNPGVLRMTP